MHMTAVRMTYVRVAVRQARTASTTPQAGTVRYSCMGTSTQIRSGQTGTYRRYARAARAGVPACVRACAVSDRPVFTRTKSSPADLTQQRALPASYCLILPHTACLIHARCTYRTVPCRAVQPASRRRHRGQVEAVCGCSARARLSAVLWDSAGVLRTGAGCHSGDERSECSMMPVLVHLCGRT
jgi:hypothetical protein